MMLRGVCKEQQKQDVWLKAVITRSQVLGKAFEAGISNFLEKQTSCWSLSLQFSVLDRANIPPACHLQLPLQ